MTAPIITVSGLRGVVGETLTPEVAARYVAAFAAALPTGAIVLGRDGRESGPMLADAIRKAVAANGRTVLDADVAATPTLGVLVRHHSAAGGVQITASHNPRQYNGIKLFGADGSVIPAAEGERIKRRYEDHSFHPTTTTRSGNVKRLADVGAPHLDLVLSTVDVPRIRSRRFRVLVDSNHGAGGALARRLLVEGLGCECVAVGELPDGQFSHPPEPTSENLSDISSKVSSAKVDLGFCQDPDADRLAVHRRKWALHRRGIHARAVRRSRIATPQGTDCYQLLDEPHVARPGGEIRRGVPSLRGRRGERHRRNAPRRRRLSAEREAAGRSTPASAMSATASSEWR